MDSARSNVIACVTMTERRSSDDGHQVDLELVTSSQTPITFAQLYAAEFVPLVRLAALLVGRGEPARDIVQDAFVRLHVRWHSVRDPSAYVRRSIVNGAASHHRRRGRRATTSVADVEQTIAAAGRPLPTTTDYDHTLATLSVLTPRQRAVVVLKFYEQRTEDEIAELVGCRPGSVGPTLQRALDRLRAEYPVGRTDRQPLRGSDPPPSH